MSEYLVQVTMEVRVKLDESKFTDDFMGEFAENFYEFEDLEDHAKHLAQLAAREVFRDEFVEGYGRPSDMGISAKVEDSYEEIIEG